MFPGTVRVWLCTLFALAITSPAPASDEAEIKKQLKKIGVYIITVDKVSATAFDNTKGTDAHMKLLPEIKGLAFIRLGDTDITDAGLKDLARCPALRQIQLGAAPHVTDAGLKELRTLHNLEDLTVDRAPQVNGSAFAELTSLKKLRKLTLRNCGIIDEQLTSIAALPSVSQLVLSHNKLTDASLASLASLKTLASLDLSGNAITDLGLKVFHDATAFPRLGAVHVSKTSVTKQGETALEQSRGKKTPIWVTR